MTDSLPELQREQKNLEKDFNLAFKLVFFDENDREVEPAQYKSLSTYIVEKEISS